jgi:hypothetical protein
MKVLENQSHLTRFLNLESNHRKVSQVREIYFSRKQIFKKALGTKTRLVAEGEKPGGKRLLKRTQTLAASKNIKFFFRSF